MGGGGGFKARIYINFTRNKLNILNVFVYTNRVNSQQIININTCYFTFCVNGRKCRLVASLFNTSPHHFFGVFRGTVGCSKSLGILRVLNYAAFIHKLKFKLICFATISKMLRY